MHAKLDSEFALLLLLSTRARVLTYPSPGLHSKNGWFVVWGVQEDDAGMYVSLTSLSLRTGDTTLRGEYHQEESASPIP